MAKERVYELARELGLESKDVLERARELGLEVKTASSGLDEDGVALLRLSYEETSTPATPAADAAPEPESEPEPEPESEPEPEKRTFLERRRLVPEYRNAMESQRVVRGADSTDLISDDRSSRDDSLL